MRSHTRRTEVETRDEQIKAVADAATAAAKKDFQGFWENLYRSRLLDGATRHLLNHYWGTFDAQDAYEITARAVDKYYEVLGEKQRPLENPAGYLWKMIANGAVDHVREKNRNVRFDGKDIDDFAAPSEDASPEELPDEDEEKRVAEGVAIARALLPQLGQENIQKVMGYILDAVERGSPEVSNQELSEALGLSVETIRVLKQRGFKRLEREARAAGYRASRVRDLLQTDDDQTDE